MEKILIFQGVEYRLDENLKHAIVKAPTVGSARFLTIPAHVIHEGVAYEVTEIGVNAFWRNIHIDGIILPDTIRVIRDCAFQSSSLNTFSRGKTNKMLKIERSAFEDCKKLQHVEFNGPVILAEPYIFYGCIDLQRMDSFRICGEIPTESFYNCKKMLDFHFDEITDVAYNAFSGVQFKRVFVLSEKLWSNDKSFSEAIRSARIYCGPKSPILDLAYDGFDIRC